MHKHYPLLLKLENKLCVVIGGGTVAERKVQDLLECGGTVKIISIVISDELKNISKNNQNITIIERPFNDSDLEGAYIAIAATNDPELNSYIAGACERSGIPVNIVDNAILSTFIIPSTLWRDDLSISVSSGGRFAGLSKKIKEDLEKLFPPDSKELIDQLVKLREKIKTEILDEKKRQKFWNDFFHDIDLLEALKSNKEILLNKIKKLLDNPEKK